VERQVAPEKGRAVPFVGPGQLVGRGGFQGQRRAALVGGVQPHTMMAAQSGVLGCTKPWPSRGAPAKQQGDRLLATRAGWPGPSLGASGGIGRLGSSAGNMTAARNGPRRGYRGVQCFTGFQQ